MPSNIAVEIPIPMVMQSFVTVWKRPPAMDCCGFEMKILRTSENSVSIF
jgi:hypothetical protein